MLWAKWKCLVVIFKTKTHHYNVDGSVKACMPSFVLLKWMKTTFAHNSSWREKRAIQNCLFTRYAVRLRFGHHFIPSCSVHDGFKNVVDCVFFVCLLACQNMHVNKRRMQLNQKLKEKIRMGVTYTERE